MSQYRVHFKHRGQPTWTVVSGENPEAARGTFQLHNPETLIERVVPVGKKAQPPVSKCEPTEAKLTSLDSPSHLANDLEREEFAASLRELRSQLADRKAERAREIVCPECGGPAERVYGRHSGQWFTRPLGCGHRPVHPAAPKQEAAFAGRRAALAVLVERRKAHSPVIHPDLISSEEPMKPVDYRNQTFESLLPLMQGMRLTALQALAKHGPCTTRELSERAGLSILTVRPRITELIDLGWVALTDPEAPGHEGTYSALSEAEARAVFATRRAEAVGTEVQPDLLSLS